MQENNTIQTTSVVEKNLIKWGEKMQTYLIEHRAKLLKEYAK